MNAECLLTHYEKIAEAPDAIARLRRFILDLAVRGKLEPQDPKDEPASDLLKRIRREKARLVKAGEIRVPKAIPDLPEPPFRIPSSWRWSQLAEIGVLNPRNEAPDTLEASFVPMPLIAAEYGAANQHDVRPWGGIKKGYTHFAEGDVGLAKITPCFENGKSTVFRNLTGGIGSGTTELHIVRPLFVDQDYILLFLKSPHFIETGIPRMTGTAGQKRVPTQYFAHSPFPLPPLAEQQRIVAKVDELMGLCDRLAAARAEREAVRDRLAAASLARLNAPDPETFRSDARFALDALPALTTRPDQIKALRQTILNLAVRGKLVPQDANDEPASELLKRIAKAHPRKQRSRAVSTNQDGPGYERDYLGLPTGWMLASLEAISSFENGDRSSNYPSGSDIKADGVPFFSTKNLSDYRLQFTNLDFITTAKFESLRSGKLQDQDILITLRGSVGKFGLFEASEAITTGFINAQLLIIRCVDRALVPYLMICMRSDDFSDQIALLSSGSATPQLSAGKLAEALIPLPPLAEQHRIVAKVDALMAFCDRLEASLTATVATRRRLLDALLAEALAPDAERVLEAAE